MLSEGKQKPKNPGFIEAIYMLSFFNFESSAEKASILEQQFREVHTRQALAADRVLGVGSGGVHILVTLALIRSGSPILAVITFLTALEQFFAAYLVAFYPKTYSKWRLSLYSFNIVWSMATANMLIQSLHFNYCKPAGSLLFWASELVNGSLPWMFLHGLVFPLPFARALITNGLAVAILISSNVHRCQNSLSACPAGGPHFQSLQKLLYQSLNIFSMASPVSDQSLNMPPIQTSISACVATYSLIHICLYATAMHMLWMLELGAKISFLSRTDRVDIEWSLEKLKRKGVQHTVLLLVELFVVVVVVNSAMQLIVPLTLPLFGYATV